jgi:hypothetical protein
MNVKWQMSHGKWQKWTSVLPFAFCLLPFTLPYASASRVQIKNGQFYVDDAPFFVRGVCYSPLRPHQRPGLSYAETNRRWEALDFERIKVAHFNTIRTWYPLTPEELALARKYDLMVLQGIWLDPKQDYADPDSQRTMVAQVRSVVEQSQPYDNLLGYLIMTEPSPAAVLASGKEEALRFFRRLKRAVQDIDPRPVSIDSGLALAFLDHSFWDFVTFNVYPFFPGSINKALGHSGVVRWLVSQFAPDRPLIVGETGGYAVSQATAGAYGGFGGLDEYEQSIHDLASLRGTVEGHAQGFCLASWLDNWAYPKDPDTHDNDPWEWDGLMAIPTDQAKDLAGIPRKVYQDMMHFNEAIVLEPKENHLYNTGERIPIKVCSADNIAEMDYSLNGGDWVPLDGSSQGWWQGFAKLPPGAKHRQRVVVRALDENQTELERTEVSFVAAVRPEQLTLRELETPKGGGPLQWTVQVLTSDQHPITQRKVVYGIYLPLTGRQAQGTLLTDERGQVRLTSPLTLQTKDQLIFVAAGTDSPDRVRAGDMRVFQLAP